MTSEFPSINAEQFTALMGPIRSSRVATRTQGGKTLSYVEAYDIKAHLTRIFGFGNWDFVVTKTQFLYQRDVTIGRDNPKPGWEVAFEVVGTLRIRDQHGRHLCEHAEGAVGYFSGAADLGGLYDNALKAGASDALKRCAIAMGTQFGLSLYQNGSKDDVIRKVIVVPEGVSNLETPTDPEAEARVAASLGATPVEE